MICLKLPIRIRPVWELLLMPLIVTTHNGMRPEVERIYAG